MFDPAAHNASPLHRAGIPVNSLFSLLGIETWKPIFTALLLPPVPFLLLIIVGARLILPRRGLGWAIILPSVAGIWRCRDSSARPACA